MINKKNLPNAYKECIEILKYIPKNEYEKVPKYIIENMIDEMNVNYNYKVTHFIDFENQDMLEETKAILAVLFREFWATEEEKIRIKEKEKNDILLLECEKKNRYKFEDIFKNESNYEKENFDNNQLIEYKKNLFNKLKEFVLKIFN